MLQVQDPYFGIVHLCDLVHGLVVIDGLDGFVDDAVAHGQYLLVGVLGADELKEAACPFTQGTYSLDVRWPYDILHVGDITAGEVAPVTFTQQGCGDHGQMVGLGNDGGGMDGTLQITGYDGIEMDAGQLVAYLTGLPDARLVELALHLSLQYLAGVVEGLAVAY